MLLYDTLKVLRIASDSEKGLRRCFWGVERWLPSVEQMHAAVLAEGLSAVPASTVGHCVTPAPGEPAALTSAGTALTGTNPHTDT